MALPFPLSDLLVILPELILSELALGILLWATVVKREKERALAWASLTSLALTAALLPVAAHFAGASDDGVRHYVRTMDLPAHAAQMVYQQALAELAGAELAEAPAAPAPTVQPAPTRIPFLKVWARAS